MSVQNASGASPSESGAQPSEEVSNEQSVDLEASTSTEKMIAYKDHRRALDDLHKNKKLAREYQDRLQEMENQKLKENENWKTYAQKKEEEAKQYKDKLSSIHESMIQEKKYDAVKLKLLKKGLRPEIEGKLSKLIDLDRVHVEATTDGRFLVHGDEDYADEFYKENSFAFKDTTTPVFNSGGATTPAKSDVPTELTGAYMVELEKQMSIGTPEERAEAKQRYQELWSKYLEQARKRRLGL